MPSDKLPLSILTVLSFLLGGTAPGRAEEKKLLNLPGAGDEKNLVKDDGPSPLLFDNIPAAPPPPPGGSSPSQNATVNLINKLVKRGVLPAEDAQELISQANAEAEQARLQAAADAGPDDAVRVTYIPETVKRQIRDELKDEVLAQARAEGWAAPNQTPDWVKKWTFFGDIRVRYHGYFFPSGNDNTGAFPIFNSINTGAPFDTSGTIFSPQANVDQNRQRMLLRARVGADVNLEHGWTAGFRFATGVDNNPVSTDQGIGVANNGQGGNFSKYALWLDRAFIRYDLVGLTYTEEQVPTSDGKGMKTVRVPHDPNGQLSFLFGRFDNPFFTTSQIVWDDDVGFDGVAIKGNYEIGGWLTPFFTAGIFPVFNTDFNFSTNQPAKFKSSDKWLNAVQFGLDLKAGRELHAKVAGAYYDFHGVEGKLSDPFIPLTPQDQGSTDDRRPSFAQNGNTYMALRNIVPDALNNYGTSLQYQYFGLATPFRVLEWNGRIDYDGFEPFQLSFFGDYAKNLAWDKSAVDAIAVNNRGPNAADGSNGGYAGGNTAWYLGAQFGKPKFEKAGDWNISFGYRYVESDAVIDGFVDNDFGSPLPGTNLKGYTVGASVALSPAVKFAVKWMAASNIAGPPFRSDLLQIDLQAKF
jgi:Putative porin